MTGKNDSTSLTMQQWHLVYYLEVESNRTNLELIFIEFFKLFFNFESLESYIFELNRTNFQRIQHLKNLTPPYSWSRIELKEFRINFHRIF